MSALLRLLLVLLPWTLRRPLLVRCYGYRLHSGSRIGLAWVFPRELVLERGARIGHLTVVKGLERLTLGEQASIGRLNWISAFPRGTGSRHFAHLPDRKPELLRRRACRDHAPAHHRLHGARHRRKVRHGRRLSLADPDAQHRPRAVPPACRARIDRRLLLRRHGLHDLGRRGITEPQRARRALDAQQSLRRAVSTVRGCAGRAGARALPRRRVLSARARVRDVRGT